MLTNFQVERPWPASGEMNPIFLPLSVLRMVWKRKLAITAIAMAGCALTVFVVRRMPSIYVSEALVLIDPQRIPEKFVPSTVGSELQDRIASINQEILSSSRLEKIISEFNLYRDERKEMFPGEVLQLMRNDISVQMERGGAGNRPVRSGSLIRGKIRKLWLEWRTASPTCTSNETSKPGKSRRKVRLNSSASNWPRQKHGWTNWRRH
jgi:hypothetical protein